ncbi:hypothetical protein [Aquimarina brevivitae]|uniref:SpoIIAA-like protein n=1 Tax=Aquimarina brevivitae TaxID=323412 RepID=A0A4Q7P1Y3_9FLAO|nr:hypothetical protein [Aquimarina brevivitae]RZS93883.1 hypothetical protein EV197_2464 [Aquimarina brevivitae]
MVYLKETPYYQDAIHEISFPSGTFYLFDTFVVAEVNEGILFTWEEHAKPVVEELTHLYDHNGSDIVYISNRVHSYATRPADWLKFYKSDFKLRAYGIVSYSRKSMLNALMEKLFMRDRFQNFATLDEAIHWAKSLSEKVSADH